MGMRMSSPNSDALSAAKIMATPIVSTLDLHHRYDGLAATNFKQSAKNLAAEHCIKFALAGLPANLPFNSDAKRKL
jgi:hypothetical protein